MIFHWKGFDSSWGVWFWTRLGIENLGVIIAYLWRLNSVHAGCLSFSLVSRSRDSALYMSRNEPGVAWLLSALLCGVFR